MNLFHQRQSSRNCEKGDFLPSSLSLPLCRLAGIRFAAKSEWIFATIESLLDRKQEGKAPTGPVTMRKMRSECDLLQFMQGFRRTDLPRSPKPECNLLMRVFLPSCFAAGKTKTQTGVIQTDCRSTWVMLCLLISTKSCNRAYNLNL